MLTHPDKQVPSLQADRTEVIASYGLKAVLVVGAAYALILRDYFMIFSAFIAVIGSMIPAILHRQWRIVLPVELDLILTAFIAVHFILGELGAFYLKFWWFDLLLHDLGGFVIGIVGFVWSYMLFYTNKIKAHPWFIFVFTISLAMAAGAVWEIFEFSMDQLFGFNMQKSGLKDTMGDLIVCVVGSVFAGLLGYFYLKHDQGGLIRRLIVRWRRQD
jgi:hypothetical protein